MLIDAMATGVPLVGFRVGGLLGDPALLRRVGDNCYQRTHERLNEKVYVAAFAGTLHRPPGATIEHRHRRSERKLE